MQALFDRFPTLAVSLPYVALGEFPTPVSRLDALGASLGHNEIFLKNDGLSCPSYGGNKVRKLEVLLGKALEQNRREVLTFGFAGSNHAAATAVAARAVGLRSISMLLPQINAHYVGQNLLVSRGVGAELHAAKTVRRLTVATAGVIVRRFLTTGRLPLVIAPGGSSPLGTIGFVAAAFELAEQIEQGVLPEPERIYATAGSMGTVAGLTLGLAAAGLRSRVIAVRVADESYVNEAGIRGLMDKTCALLRRYDGSFPEITAAQGNLELRHDRYGRNYAVFTEDGREATRLLRELEGLTLDGTYTAKTMAALLGDLRGDRSTKKPVLFWNTYNARDLSPLSEGVRYEDLPKVFHRYFETKCQDDE